jgi:hypothetical protein
MHPLLLTILLLCASNVFMVYAWYGHLRDLSAKPLVFVIAASWGVAFFEYCLMIPANRIGYRVMDLGQLKVIQEVIHLSVFALFAVFYMRQSLRMDHLYAFFCLLGAVFFLFRKGV